MVNCLGLSLVDNHWVVVAGVHSKLCILLKSSITTHSKCAKHKGSQGKIKEHGRESKAWQKRGSVRRSQTSWSRVVSGLMWGCTLTALRSWRLHSWPWTSP